MQTFLPYPDFQASAECLDKRRCWKQVVEASQIINMLLNGNPKVGFYNHPAVRMWRGFLPALVCYYNVFWTWNVEHHKIKVNKLQKMDNLPGPALYPLWMGYPELHASHRGRLLDKDFEYYSKFGWIEKPRSEDEGYVWPVDKDNRLLFGVTDWVMANVQKEEQKCLYKICPDKL